MSRKGTILPRSQHIRVVYLKDGVQYGRVMKNPHTYDSLQQQMLVLRVGMHDVVRVEPAK